MSLNLKKKMVIFPYLEKVIINQPCPPEQFNREFQFLTIEKDTTEGYLTLKGDDSTYYLFLCEGRIYSAGKIEEGEMLDIPIRDFFTHFSKLSRPFISFYRTDEVLLKSLIVFFQHTPTTQVTSDIVDVEEILAKIKDKGADSVLAIREDEKLSLVLCCDGEPSYIYLAEEIEDVEKEETPQDKLLVYIYNKEPQLTFGIDIYQDIVVTPAPDAGFPDYDFKGEIYEYFTRPRPFILLKLGENTLGRYTIKFTKLTIGRVPDNDVMIDNLAVSRHHAIITEERGSFYVEDQQSVNGTFVNGEKVTRRELSNNDEILIGKHKLIFQESSKTKPEEVALQLADGKTILLDTAALKRIREYAPSPHRKVYLILPDRESMEISTDPFLIGKGDEADLKLKGMGIGHIQAKIVRDKEEEYRLIHVGGWKTTRINGAKISEQTLLDGDEIQIGKYRLIFRSGG